jgi:hypothetical protein
MSLVLQSSGGGSVTVQEPTTASNFTATLPAATGDVALLQTPVFATTIGVGGATPAASGAGITFPSTASASSDANTLDDYEEGTWTPTVRGGSTAGTYTPSSVRSYYTKIGNQVTCWAGFGFSAASGGTGIIVIDGFPFSYKGSSAINASLNTINLNTAASSSNGVCMSNTTSASATTFYIFLNIDNSTQEEVAIGAISTSTQLQFTLTYTVS